MDRFLTSMLIKQALSTLPLVNDLDLVFRCQKAPIKSIVDKVWMRAFITGRIGKDAESIGR